MAEQEKRRVPQCGDDVIVPNGSGMPIRGTIENIDDTNRLAKIKLEGYGYRISIPVDALSQIVV